MIRSGEIADISWSTGKWMFIDIGFSSKSSSCGVLFHDSKPERRTFGEAVEDVKVATRTSSILNLVIEAPLSVAFDKSGNPIGRSIEKHNHQTRYWYVGAGCVVMISTLYLIKQVISENPAGEVKLFEGFVSYKTVKSDHLRDVKLLHDVIKDPRSYKDCIFDLSNEPGIVSAFKVMGFDFGIPPIIMRRLE